MKLLDVNVLVAAFRVEMPDHRAVKGWLDTLIAGAESFGAVDGVLCGFVRIVTQKPFDPVTPVGKALDFVAAIRLAVNFRSVQPGRSQWSIFEKVCRSTG